MIVEELARDEGVKFSPTMSCSQVRVGQLMAPFAKETIGSLLRRGRATANPAG
jgi:hypothetical protein